MARQRNVVQKTVLEVGDPDVARQLARRLGVQAVEVRKLYREVVPQVAQAVRYRVIVFMLERLRMYPPRNVGMKIRWKSRKQQKYVMMKLRKEGNLPYRRTRKLALGWVADVKLDPRSGKIGVVTQNTAASEDRGKLVKYQRFVSGDIGLGISRQSLARYKAPIQPFHTDRGWNPAAPIIKEYYAKADATAEEMLERKVAHILQRN